MTKQEFMTELKNELAGKLPADTCTEILADFAEHFNEALLAGEPEDAVCKVLGEPAEIAAQCVESNLWKEEHGEQRLERGHSETEEVKRLRISLLDMHLVCNPSHNGKFRVEVRKNNVLTQEDTLQVHRTGNAMEVLQKMDPKRLFFLQIFRLAVNKTVYVEVPVQFQGNIDAAVVSGNAKFSNLQAERLSCDVKSGSIRLESIDAKKGIRAVSISGNVHLEDCGDSMEAESYSGNVKLEGCRGHAEVKSRSGNSTVQQHKGFVKAKTLSGNINVETDRIAQDTEFKVKSGNVIVTLQQLTANLYAESLSGNVTLNVSELEGNLTGKTFSGNTVANLSSETMATYHIKSGLKEFHYGSGPDRAVLPTVSLSALSGRAKVNGPLLDK